MDKIWLSPPHLNSDARKYVEEAFDSNWIAPIGPHVDRFEKSIASTCGVSHVAALNSGTAAIHLGLKLLGVSSGDYVVSQSLTFCASVNPATYLGAVPIFIDSELDTWNMDPNILEDVLKVYGEKVKAVIPVHLYGMPAKMKEIKEVAGRYHIPVLEDAAEALGSYYQDKPCGSTGDLSVLSFNGNKIITTSGGGALLGNNEEMIQKAKFLATQARDPAPHYQHTEIGFNYALSNVSAAIGLAQLEVLEDRVAKRKANFEKYQAYFKSKEKNGYQVAFQPELTESKSNRWLTCIIINPQKNKGKTREDVRIAFEGKNIESRPLWKPMHNQPAYAGLAYVGGNVSGSLFENGLCLPSGSNLSNDDFDRIFDTLDLVFK